MYATDCHVPDVFCRRFSAMGGCPRLNSCLCCPLPSGVLAIGITCLVLNTLGSLFMGGILGSPDLVRAAIREDPALLDGDGPEEEQVEQMLLGIRVLFGLGLADMLICAALDIGLLVGNSKSWPRPLLAWTVGYSLTVAGMIGFGLYLAVLMVATADRSPDIWFFIVCQLLMGGVGIYLVMVVYSYYRVLRERETGGGYSLQPMTTA